ncbi:MAG: glycosyltransferase family 2 protein [bacterium]|nr:glycosyltransferase family 2 protein [bacterium]
MPDGRVWPKISIVTPNYNYSRYLEATIRSVLLQGYPNLEYIVIDGGSTDGSIEIIRKYEPWISFWTSGPDRGQSEAINRGMAKTTGEIMAWINSDDMYQPWTFRTVAEIFSLHSDVNWLVGCNSWWDEEGRQIAVKPVYKNIYNYLLNDYGWIQQESVFWRRPLWEKAGGGLDENYIHQMDAELWCRFFVLDHLWHVDAVIGGFRRHAASKTRQNQQDTLAAIEHAIAAMNRSVPESLLKNARILRRMRAAKKFLPWINVERIARLIFRGLYREADYGRISFIGGAWVKNTAPFMTGAWKPGTPNFHARNDAD